MLDHLDYGVMLVGELGHVRLANRSAWRDCAGTRALRVRGRSTGKRRGVVINLLTADGRDYVVSPRGNTQWVRNARAAGGGQLRLGSRTEDVQLVELPADQRVPVLRVYLTRWGWEVGRFVEGLSKKSTDTEIAAVAPGIPVFHVSRTAA